MSNPSTTNPSSNAKNNSNSRVARQPPGTQQPWGEVSNANTRPNQPQPAVGQVPPVQAGQQQGYPPNSGGAMYPPQVTVPGYASQFGGGYAPQQPPPANASGGTSLSKASTGPAGGGGPATQGGPPPPYAQQQQQQGYMMYRGQVPPGAPPPQYYQQQQQQYNPNFYRPSPVGNWQPNYPNPGYHPNPNQPSGMPAVPASAVPRRRAPSVITTKDGKKIDLVPSNKLKDSKAGESMLALAKSLMAGSKSAKQLREEEETKKKEEEEKLEKERREKEELEIREKEEKERHEKERQLREEQEMRIREEKAREEKEMQERREKDQKEKLKKEKLERERLEKEKQVEPPKPRAGGFRPGGGLRPGGSRRGGSALSNPSMENLSISRKVYTKQDLLSYRDKDICRIKPDGLPDFTIRIFPAGNNQAPRNNRSGGKPDPSWNRGQSQPNSGNNTNGARRQNNTGGNQWNRGQAPPPMKNKPGHHKGGNNNRDFIDPNVVVVPLVASENRWVPKKDDSAFAVAEKSVMSILNKMTKEKFGKLSQKMCEFDISSYEILSMMIHSVYEKAIDEPSFGDIYAQLCVLLAKKVSASNFINIIQTDEQKGSDCFRWSNNVSSSDTEVLGPFISPQECIQVALDESVELKPMERGDKEMSIVYCRIVEDTFIKILSHEDKFYSVCFPLAKAKDCGQQLSPKIFKTEEECAVNAKKQNSFKSILLNKCQDEFSKQDIYAEWKKEKKGFDKIMGTLAESDREEKKADMLFRRIKIKKQMLGNIKFIGELYKMAMIKEHIMHFCIRALLKLDTIDNKIYEMEDDEMDEEDHEALCKLFTTVGKTIDDDKNRMTINIYFQKMSRLSSDTQLSSRSRFMYKDLIELRGNRWKCRREQETAKTLNEIRKDVAREERQQSQTSHSNPNKHMGNRRNANQNTSDRRFTSSTSKSKGQPKQSEGADGWAVVSGKPGGHTNTTTMGALPSIASIRPASSKPDSKAPAAPKQKVVSKPSASTPPTASKQKVPDELSKTKLETKIKSMRSEFQENQSNTEDVFLTMGEMIGTPGYGRAVVEQSMDFIFECKAPERKGAIALLTLLYTNGKLSQEDVEGGMADYVEFIDSFAVDVPHAFQFVGEVLSAYLQMKALSKEWVREKCQTLGQGYGEKVISETEQALSKMFSVSGMDALA